MNEIYKQYKSKGVEILGLAYERTADFTAENLHRVFSEAQSKTGFSPKEAFMSLRVAISGRTVTPPLFDCLVILGKKETIGRIKSVFA